MMIPGENLDWTGSLILVLSCGGRRWKHNLISDHSPLLLLLMPCQFHLQEELQKWVEGFGLLTLA